MLTCKVDLHVHTVLSPCADLLMTPANIIKKACEQEIDLLAITDHNSAENVEVFMKLATKTQLTVIPGMEVETKEEVHLLCLFSGLDEVLTLQEIVYNALPDFKNDEDYFGYQIVTDINDNYRGKVIRLLAAATSLSLTEVVDYVHKLNGIVIPSHIDRTNGLLYNLGLIPPQLELSILEMSKDTDMKELNIKYPGLEEYYIIRNSDSHYLTDLKPMMSLKLENISLQEMSAAIKNEKGKKFLE